VPPRSLSLALVFIIAAAWLIEPVSALAANDSKAPTHPQHVFVIVLENKTFDSTFGKPSEAPYLYSLAHARGKLLTQYYAIGHYSLDNYIAMISGQAPNGSTQADCPVYTEFMPQDAKLDKDGQVAGVGCVYPSSVTTLANQLDKKGLTWRAYMEDMTRNCEHPVTGEKDPTQIARLDPNTHQYHQYAAKHDPFVYFHSIVDSPECQKNVVPLSNLDSDLKSIETTPNFVFISPNLCDDGHDEKCADGKPGGLAGIDRFLKNSKIVDRITSSPAFKKDGMLIITFDEADFDDSPDANSSCCNEQTGPNTVSPGYPGTGGGRTGTIIISPFACPKTADNVPYNHYSLLKSIEQLFGLKYLGFANQKNLKAFGTDVYDTHPGAHTCYSAK